MPSSVAAALALGASALVVAVVATSIAGAAISRLSEAENDPKRFCGVAQDSSVAGSATGFVALNAWTDEIGWFWVTENMIVDEMHIYGPISDEGPLEPALHLCGGADRDPCEPGRVVEGGFAILPADDHDDHDEDKDTQPDTYEMMVRILEEPWLFVVQLHDTGVGETITMPMLSTCQSH